MAEATTPLAPTAPSTRPRAGHALGHRGGCSRIDPQRGTTFAARNSRSWTRIFPAPGLTYLLALSLDSGRA